MITAAPRNDSITAHGSHAFLPRSPLSTLFILFTALLMALAGLACPSPHKVELPCRGQCPPGTECNPATDRCEGPPVVPVIPQDLGRSISTAVTPEGTLLVATFSEDEGGVVLMTYPTASTEAVSVVLVDGNREMQLGQWISLAVCPQDGKRWLAYTCPSTQELRVAWSDPEDDRWKVEIADTGPDRGAFVSLALSPADCAPHVAYHDSQASTLRYSTRIGGARWSAENVDGPAMDHQGSPVPVGKFASLVMVDNEPLIAYYHGGDGGTLKVARRDGRQWRNWVVDGVDPDTGASSGDVGRWASAALDRSGNVAIAYHDSSRGHLRYAWSDKGILRIATVDPLTTTDSHLEDHSHASDWDAGMDAAMDAGMGADMDAGPAADPDVGLPSTPRPPSPDRNMGQYASLAFDHQGFPVIAHLDANNLNLRLSRRNAEDRWASHVLASERQAGFWASVAVIPPSETQPITAPIRIAHCRLAFTSDGARRGSVEVLIK